MAPSNRWLLVFATLLAMHIPPQAAGQSLEQAEDALDIRDQVGEALGLYTEIAEGDGRLEDRAEAARMAARIHWRIMRDYRGAERLLSSALIRGIGETDILLEMSFMELDHKRYAEAHAAAERALARAETVDEIRRAKIGYGRAVIGECTDAVREGRGCDMARLRQAADHLRDLVTDPPCQIEEAGLLLRAAILLGDGQTALEAWHAYFRVVPGDRAYGALASPQHELSELWPRWQHPSPEQAAVHRLIRALADSRLYREALVVSLIYGVGEGAPADIQDILVYGRTIWEIEEFTDEYYRLLLHSLQDQSRQWFTPLVSKWIDMFVDAVGELWKQSTWVKEEYPLSLPFDLTDPGQLTAALRVSGALRDRFGTVIRLSGDLCMGHAIIDESRRVNQYGYGGDLTYLLIDSMVSRGFAGWATGYKRQYGGFALAEENAFVEVREAFADNAITAWNKTTDPAQRRQWETDIATLSTDDWHLAAEDPYAYLPGLGNRLKLAAYDRLLTQIAEEGYTGPEVQSEFVKRIDDAHWRSDIWAHEGRHVMDNRLGVSDGAELEFRAKLSQVAFAPMPRLAFNSIFTPEIGSGTPHGEANLRIVKNIVKWMRANANNIENLDPAKPLLPQFDLLTDQQMKEVMQSMDPLWIESR